jgi:hypothetical protein
MNEVIEMSDLEIIVRRRMQEEYAKGTSAERIIRLVQEIFNSLDAARPNASRAASSDR